MAKGEAAGGEGAGKAIAPALDPESTAQDADIGAMSFERALAELEGIVHELERGELELEAAIAAYTRGTRLRQHCAQKLKEAQLKVEQITLGDNGRPGAAPVDLG